MIVEKDLVFFQVLWKGEVNLVKDSQKTKDLIDAWLKGRNSGLELRDYGASSDGPINLVLKNEYSKDEAGKVLFSMHIRNLIKTLRENDEVCKVWLKWDDMTEDFFYNTDDSILGYFDIKEYKKEDYVLIHENNAQ